ncbi:MAG TPA: FlgD immunoglobulin-like domain containing protein, partial [Thermoanaerobaculaceae bacterium]|nr:FlgD immunoglobulin-like domain containing protein [Thermoanaerobaculaceae bacterium]
VADSGDSGWNPAANEIVSLGCQWDDTYLYLGIRGIATANSWLLYLDTDPGGTHGFTDLTAIDHWERGATFTASGFRPDWQFGAYQHQGIYDGESFWKLLSATSSADSTSAILAAFDPMHRNGLNGGSEIAIPWNTLYGLGAGHVPASCRIGFVASLAWDPEPNGALGGDQAPNNVSATPPVLDNYQLVVVDADGNGVPDPTDRTAPTLLAATTPGWDSVVVLQFSEPVTAATAEQAARYSIYQTANPSATLTVRGATLQSDARYVQLLVSPMAHVGYTVVASGVADVSCFHNASPQTSTAFQGPPVSVDPTAPRAGALRLAPPAPNPTRGPAVLTYALPGTGESRVALEMYDLGGRLVRTLVRASQSAGEYRVAWDGRDDHGRRLASGVYFVRLSLGARQQQVKRLVILP